MTMIDLQKATIGVIGLGQIGGGISENLARAGYHMLGYDPKQSAQDRLKAAGGEIAESIDQIVAECEIILLILHGSVSVPVAENILLKSCREGQIVIDHSTIPAPKAREFGQAFRERGVRYMDVPVSGGHIGASAGELRMFAGGEKDIFDYCWPLFETAGNPKKVQLYGQVGMGQVAKVVQQLTDRLPNMARVEVVAFGLQAGLSREQVMKAVDYEPGEPHGYAGVFNWIEEDNKEHLSGLASEWGYYVQELKARGLRMPMLEGAYELVKDAEKTTVDNLNRPMPCYFDELMKAGRTDTHNKSKP